MTKIIEAQNVCKNIGSKQILKNISLEMREGVIFALLGPNGAGKTTFMKSLLNLTEIQSGQISIKGIPVTKEQARERLTYLPEKFSFFPYYTVKGTLLFFGRMFGVPKQELETQAQKALERLHIDSIQDQKLKTLSKGQLQRVGLAKLLMGQPELLVLDEPFSGLDPIGIKDLKKLMLDLRKEGKSIFINSHLLSEAEQICDDLSIMNEGQILASGNVKELIKEKSLEDFFYQTIKGQGAIA